MHEIKSCPIKVCETELGVSHEALYTIYKGTILPLLLYGVQVWIEALEKECNRTVCNRVQRLINIKTAKAYRTTSNEALCILTGLTPIVIKAEETATIYSLTRKRQVHNIDHEVQPKDWLHPADSELPNKKLSTPYKYLQTAARASTGLEREL